jgi:hypothetical protein
LDHIRLVGIARDAEVAKFDLAGRKEYIGRLDVSVDEAALMDSMDGRSKLREPESVELGLSSVCN